MSAVHVYSAVDSSLFLLHLQILFMWVFCARIMLHNAVSHLYVLYRFYLSVLCALILQRLLFDVVLWCVFSYCGVVMVLMLYLCSVVHGAWQQTPIGVDLKLYREWVKSWFNNIRVHTMHYDTMILHHTTVYISMQSCKCTHTVSNMPLNYTFNSTYL